MLEHRHARVHRPSLRLWSAPGSCFISSRIWLVGLSFLNFDSRGGCKNNPVEAESSGCVLLEVGIFVGLSGDSTRVKIVCKTRILLKPREFCKIPIFLQNGVRGGCFLGEFVKITLSIFVASRDRSKMDTVT